MEPPVKRTHSGSPRPPARPPGLDGGGGGGGDSSSDDGASSRRSHEEDESGADDDDDDDDSEDGWEYEEEWYDVYVRLPWGEEANAKTDVDVPPPDRSEALSYRRPADPPGGPPFCRLVIGSYVKDTDPTVVSSGLVVWEASAQLCRYLLRDPDLGRAPRVLELGSGTGGPGLLAHRLRRKTTPPPPPYRRIGAPEPGPPRPPVTMLTDGVVNALMNLRRNVRDNSSPR